MKRCALKGFAILLTAATLAACGQSEDVLATFEGGAITAEDFDQFLLSLPESRREIGNDQGPEEWALFNLEQLAIQRILKNSDRAREIAASDEMQAFRLWTHSGLLARKLASRLDEEWQPDPAELAAEIQEMQRRADIRSLYTFRHIYFRTDRASSPAEVEATRRRARRVADLARSGADFEGLVREHSDSEDSERGGVIGNVSPAALDDTTAGILASMSEGEVSPVVETRTGLHIFRLEQAIESEPLSEERIISTARNMLRRRQLQEEQTALLEELRNRIPIETGDSGWKIGSWQVGDSVLAFVQVPGGAVADAPERQVVDQFLLAQEAMDRGLETPDVEEEVEHVMDSTVLERCLAEVRRDLVTEVPEDQLRDLYDAQPSRFEEGEKARVEMIFIPQGKDSFTTQRGVEDLVAQLRAGASFSDAARELSVGPGADQGGDLGVLELKEWGAFGPPVFKALRELETGVVSDPIYCTDKVLGSSSLLKGGFAVVRVKERIPVTARSFDDAIDDVRRAWVMKNREAVTAMVEERILTEGEFRIVRLPSPEEPQQ